VHGNGAASEAFFPHIRRLAHGRLLGPQYTHLLLHLRADKHRAQSRHCHRDFGRARSALRDSPDGKRYADWSRQ